ncbi:hypothetical protein ACIPY3_00915 [Paenarthrobacter sp. NPDC089714]|uniref:hypothetical protein n=1 Tax=Paenarthrobacter sp. NPDC089714 TaxID=3364377 RepID=UPI0037F45426
MAVFDLGAQTLPTLVRQSDASHQDLGALVRRFRGIVALVRSTLAQTDDTATTAVSAARNAVQGIG